MAISDNEGGYGDVILIRRFVFYLYQLQFADDERCGYGISPSCYLIASVCHGSFNILI